MAFKITPVVDRQKQYASAVWDFFVDGGTTAVIPKTTTSLPLGAIIVDLTIENVRTVVSGGTPTLKIKVGSNEIAAAAVWADYKVLNNAVNPTPTPKKITDDDRVINFLFSDTTTAGSVAATIGYFLPADYMDLDNGQIT
tara:strand:+ start:2075 stop:2494 length:420 start_codon:yes stop_codon:yes gene_type:complete